MSPKKFIMSTAEVWDCKSRAHWEQQAWRKKWMKRTNIGNNMIEEEGEGEKDWEEFMNDDGGLSDYEHVTDCWLQSALTTVCQRRQGRRTRKKRTVLCSCPTCGLEEKIQFDCYEIDRSTYFKHETCVGCFRVSVQGILTSSVTRILPPSTVCHHPDTRAPVPDPRHMVPSELGRNPP